MLSFPVRLKKFPCLFINKHQWWARPAELGTDVFGTVSHCASPGPTPSVLVVQEESLSWCWPWTLLQHLQSPCFRLKNHNWASRWVRWCFLLLLHSTKDISQPKPGHLWRRPYLETVFANMMKLRLGRVGLNTAWQVPCKEEAGVDTHMWSHVRTGGRMLPGKDCLWMLKLEEARENPPPEVWRKHSPANILCSDFPL